MRHILLSLCAMTVLALMLPGCADPTEGISEAQINLPEPAASAEIAQLAADPAPTARPLDTGAKAEEPAVQELEIGHYILSDDSAIGFEGYKVTGSHIGGFGKFEASVTIPEDDIHLGKISVTIDMNSTYSDDPGLTTILKGTDFFDVAQFPQASFASTQIARAEDGYSVSGDLTLHGVTKNISFPATITLEDGKLIAEAEFTINRSDFNIVYAGVADDLIKEKVVIRLDVEGAKRD